MAFLLHHLISEAAHRDAAAPALLFKKESLDYGTLEDQVAKAAAGLRALGVSRDERVAVYLPKQFEAAVGMFAAMAAGGVFVPVNPVLKTTQVEHILRDCQTRVLITSASRASLRAEVLSECPDLEHVVLTDEQVPEGLHIADVTVRTWLELFGPATLPDSRRIDGDMAAILYTSGSTGRPKGVVLSHHNMMAGAHSVSSYLHNTADDRLLAVLPFSFDYGLSQLTTAFSVGASVVMMDYLLPRDVVRAVAKYRITGLAAVPPLWNQLATLDWPEDAVSSLRYITNSGGAMPLATIDSLRSSLPDTDVYLMYGLTEAFRSTYLPPDQIAHRPQSMGKAIPNAEVMVVRPDGTECDVDEPGELVHRGALVSLGYWNDKDKTDARFKPAPGQPAGLPNPELAVWSGDRVRRDVDGYLYFISRDDEMIKTSGYRVSPGEIEEIVYQLDAVEQAVVLGAPHPRIGAGIVLVVQSAKQALSMEDVDAHCRAKLPMFMLPGHIDLVDELPRNPNGKLDRNTLSSRYTDVFTSEDGDT